MTYSQQKPARGRSSHFVFLSPLLLLLILSIFLVAASGTSLAQPFGPAEEEFAGTVEVLHEDRDVGSRYVYFLHTATERLELLFAADPPELASGDHIRARGLRTNGVLALTSSTITGTPSSGLQDTFGAQKTLVILVNFASNPTEPYTVASAQSVVDTTSNFDLENSFQETWLDATVVGWYTVNFTSSTCDYNTIASLAEQAASAHGVNVSAFNRRVYAFPNFSGCSWWGLGSVGGKPSKAWINGSFQLRVLGHEMGHNYGLYHSHSLSCVTTICSASEYGHNWDIMGATSGHFNAFQKERLGWLNYNVLPPIISVASDGVYNIFPYEAQTVDPKALKILKSTDLSTGKRTYYYVEYRAGLGFDSSLSKAVILSTGSESSANSSYLWDLDQETSTTDWVLNVGQSYTDANAGVTIALLSMDSTGASVSVTFGPTPFIYSSPTVAVAPTPQWVTGLTGDYTVTVTNNDSSSCTASSFDLSAAVPSGWAATFGSLAALSPGAKSSPTSLRLTAPSGTLDGFYNFTASATKSSAVTYKGSAAGVEVCCSGILAVKTTTDKSSYTVNTFVNITVNVRVGPTNVSGASVTVNIQLAGSTSTLVTLSGVTDSNGNVKFKWKIPQKATLGTYQVPTTASANGYTGNTNTATFKVTAR